MSYQTENDSHNQSPEPSPTSDWKGPAILALVIGINKYPSSSESCLQFAVEDADTFEQFLKQRLNVPDANIISLRDEQASRAEILSGFISLRDNAKYERDEAAIIIYYAGHGAQTSKPDGWQDWVTGQHIEMLCPSDIHSLNGDHVVEGIPDRTISVLLNEISDVKGNNITLILDCCCSAGMNRGEELEELENCVIRRISNPPQIKNSTDQELWSHGTRSGNISDGFYGKFNASHVLLAACGRDQLAHEHPKIKHGFFTSSLMKVLGGNDINTLTYTSLMHKMKMPPWQTPHCEGQGVYRRLFNNRALGADSSFILAKRETPKRTSSLLLEAGAAQGITVGSRMAVHASNLLEIAGSPNPCLGYLTVTSVGPITSVLEIPPDTKDIQYPKLFYYCLIEYRASRKIALYCEDRRWLETIFPPEEHNQSAIIIVDDMQSCDLQLAVFSGKVYFDRHNALVAPHIGTRISHTIDVGDESAIRNVVKSSLNFYHHLTRTGSDDFRNVWMELKNLIPIDDFDQDFTPIGENLIADEPATIVVDEFASLGMTIFNQTELFLYPYLFYFDPTDLTIIEWYTPPFGAGPSHLTTKLDAPLPPKSMLTIGYGNGGANPWQFMFREGDKKDIGFFKLFLSTCPSSFSSILQQSPFELEIDMPRGGESVVPDAPAAKWATKLATVIQVDS
ncbi:hypothetical protein BYT27DRAFT_7187712 [Phlegmacium glaucopus]|nr:hypothetical protein BYT27DRAFT_7187712 [Phlegmacium glaucopus]